MQKKRTKVGPIKKSKILGELQTPGHNISQIAANYKVSVGLLYSWKTHINKINRQKAQPLQNEAGGFVEVAVDKMLPQPSNLCKLTAKVSVLR